MRQLDGMGGGLSSLSKICIVGPSDRPDADVDYTFAQVGVNSTVVDFNSNCGNMSSAIGPFAVDEGFVTPQGDGPTVVRIHNTNSGKIIHARFVVEDGVAAVDGDTVIPGVSGSGATVELAFQNPAGTRGRGLTPSGSLCDELVLPDDSKVVVTCIDAATPAVFVSAQAAGISGTIDPMTLDADKGAMQRLEVIRRAASVAMGITPNIEEAAKIMSIPKIAIVSGPADYSCLDGTKVVASRCDIAIRMISAGQAHRAVPITGALALAAAASQAGSVPHGLLAAGTSIEALRLATPSGVIIVGCDLDDTGAVLSANVVRTQRRLMDGQIYLRRSAFSSDTLNELTDLKETA
ncbi:3-methylitaconate isomerase [Paracoccus haematequi]|uniref:3-methylitaconate isomerase n=2 Tax=Paracoccus haematequi TaxID=2491866 RepID=A0A447IT76_9RHOB|nr:3-methylitaconate isomerase [Paracoccus haematequi]